MTRADAWWERLLAELRTVGDVVEQPGGLVLTADGRRVEIVMTDDDWDDLVSIPYGSVAPAVAHVIALVTVALEHRVPFLAYEQYDLHPSSTPGLPEMRADMDRRVEEARRANPDATFGWFAYPPERGESR